MTARREVAILGGLLFVVQPAPAEAPFARKGARTFAAGAATYEATAGEMRKAASGTVVRVRQSQIAWLEPMFVLPLAPTATCDLTVTVAVQDTE